MEVADIAIKPVKEFAKDSYRLVRKCTKPDRKEFSKIATRTGLGFITEHVVANRPVDRRIRNANQMPKGFPPAAPDRDARDERL